MTFKVVKPFSVNQKQFKIGDVVTKEDLGVAGYSVAFSNGCLEATDKLQAQPQPFKDMLKPE